MAQAQISLQLCAECIGGETTLARARFDARMHSLSLFSHVNYGAQQFPTCHLLPAVARVLRQPMQVTAQISEKTGHLPGVAIAIMGCIVNGVGEMADADFGYVGGAPGKVRFF